VTFWSGDTLLARLKPGKIIRPFDEKRIDCASYRLRIGSEIYVSPKGSGPDLSASTKRKLAEGEEFIIEPGQFAFIITDEWIDVPRKAMAFISIRAGYKLKGLVNISGFHADPGYRGRLIFSVINAGPRLVALKRGEPCFLIFFAELDIESEKYFKDKDGHDDIGLDVLDPVRGEMQSLDTLHEKVEALDKRVGAAEPKLENLKGYLGIAITVLIAIAVQLGLLLTRPSQPTQSSPPVQVMVAPQTAPTQTPPPPPPPVQRRQQ
jgi:dCTP deaminase